MLNIHELYTSISTKLIEGELPSNISHAYTREFIDFIINGLNKQAGTLITSTDILSGKIYLINDTMKCIKKKYSYNTIILKATILGHYMGTDKSILTNILSGLGHGLATVGEKDAICRRLVNYLVYLAVQHKKGNIIVLIDEAQNIATKDFKIISKISKEVRLQQINILFVLITSKEESSRLIYQAILLARKDFRQSVFRVDAITDKVHMAYILLQFHSSIRRFFPDAYKDGIRISNEASVLFDTFTKYANNLVGRFTGVPVEIVIRTIDICLVVNGIKGLKHYWPTKDDWLVAITASSYDRYLQVTSNNNY